jgi:hypothetical protein
MRRSRAPASHLIGKRPNRFYWDGRIDEVAIHDRALSAGEIWAIFRAGSSGRCRPDGS